MNNLIKQHLSRSRLHMKKQADKKRSERQFKVGDMVFLKLQPYVQSSLAPRANQKLAFRYFGPFPVIDRVGAVAYRLDLPPSSSIHPVFHVSQLKLAVSPDQVIPTLPPEFDCPRVPEAVLQRRGIMRDNTKVQQVLIKWSNWPKEMATWEDILPLQQQFPCAPAWGQAGSEEEGNVGPSLPSRPKKPNVRLAGNEWIR